MPDVLAGFARVLRPGGVVLAGFHVSDACHHKTTGYSGHPMSVWVHLRPVERMARWLADAGFDVQAQTVRTDQDGTGGQHGFVIAHRAP